MSDSTKAPLGVKVEALRAGRESLRGVWRALRDGDLLELQRIAPSVGDEFAATREIRRRRGLRR